METSLTAAEVLVPPQPEGEEEAAPPAASSSSSSSTSSSDQPEPLEEFKRRLEDIISTHGSAGVLLDDQRVMEDEMENIKKDAKDDIPVAMETEMCLILKSLNQTSSPEQKLEEVVRRCAELVALRRTDDRRLCALQQRFSVLLDERQQLQEDSRSNAAARCKLENLCRDLQRHYELLREDTLRRCREDEQKRTEITTHFQIMLNDIQTQIEQHSSRNDKLCVENSNLTDRLESLMNQCELREESLEKINKRRDLQHKLTEAKLQQANAQLAEAEEKHKREKEYLLREAIEKTKKCFAMKEQELTMKKKLLVQAAEWKLQTQTLREQGAVMQAQLTLYAQKFDEFQGTLAKSNEIYVRFKNEMDNMTEKMKKMEKESSLWKTRFENCNKALTDMIEERTEKNKEYNLFVLKIQKLERLCQALQSERVVLYDKIKEVRLANSDIPSKVFSSSEGDSTPDPDKTTALTPVELQELQELQKEDLVLTEDMSRLREEQAKLQEIAESLLTITNDSDEADKHDVDPEEDLVSAAFVQFKTKPQVKKEASVPSDVKPESDKDEALPKLASPVESIPEMTLEDTKPEEVPTQVEDKDIVKPEEEIQQQTTEPVPTSELEKVQMSPPAELKPKAAEAEIMVKAEEAKPVVPVEEKKVPIEDKKVPVEDKKVPVEDKKVPVEDKKVPIEDTKVPVEDTKVPVEDKKVPIEDTKVPVEDTKVPVEDKKVPVEDTKVPVEDKKVQAEPVPVPEAQPSGHTPKTTAESSKKQTPKKKKKKNNKNAS